MATPYECSEALFNEVKKAVKGKDECIQRAFATILAKGHILIEDVPGVGKTTLAMAFSNAMGLKNQRVQFTPDVMPADILGFSMYKKETGNFEYKEGPIMCNLFLADEINRATPKTQSAMLEVMQEHKVTISNVTYKMAEPFFVLATENPVEQDGTYPLPEAQMDRFMFKLIMEFPGIDELTNIVTMTQITLDENTLGLMAYENNGDYTSFNNALKDIDKYNKVAIIVGPEGGFSNDEVDYLVKAGFKNISLGKRILRSETASMYALSVISFYLESR